MLLWHINYIAIKPKKGNIKIFSPTLLIYSEDYTVCAFCSVILIGSALALKTIKSYLIL